MSRYQQFFFILLLSISAQQGIAQSGWTRSAKSLYVQGTASYFSSNEYYGTDGTLFDQGSTFQNGTFQLYGEYGLFPQLTAMANISSIKVNRFSSTESVVGLGDVQLGLKYQISKKIPIAISVMADIPTNNGISFARAKEANAFGTFDQINLPTSDGEFNVWTGLAFSNSFAEGKAYASIYGQVNWRTQSFSNQLQLGGELGYQFWDKLYLIGKVSIQEKFSKAQDSGASFLYGEGTTFTSLGISAMYSVGKHIHLVAGITDYNSLLSTQRNIYDGHTFSLGVALEY